MIRFLNLQRSNNTISQVIFKSCEWLEYYETAKPQEEAPKSRLECQDRSYYVKECIFIPASTYNGNGAATYFNVDGQLLVEHSLFVNCKTNNKDGGAIFVGKGECIVAYTCANGCSAGTEWGQFSSQYATRSGIKQNQIVDSSVAYCNSDENGIDAFRMRYGKITFRAVNVSRNTIYQSVAIDVHPTNNNLKNETNADSSVTYCTVSNNKALTNNIIWMGYQTSNPTHFMTHCNIIENSQANDDYGLIFTNGYIISNINYCCIFGNNCGKLFQAYDLTTTMNINNCTIDSIKGIDETQGMIAATSFIFGIGHFETAQYCYASFDVVSSLTQLPIPNRTPAQTQKATINYHNAMKNVISNCGIILFSGASCFLETYDLF